MRATGRCSDVSRSLSRPRSADQEEDVMKSYLFVSFLLLLGAALQDPAHAQSVAGGSASESAAGTEARQPAMARQPAVARPPAMARQPGAMTRPEHERENRGSAAYLGYPDAIIMP